jgi:hypothetical protein
MDDALREGARRCISYTHSVWGYLGSGGCGYAEEVRPIHHLDGMSWL